MLKDRGFNKAGSFRIPHLVIDYRGEWKSGKTHQLLTAPGPIAVFSLNIGTCGVMEKFAKEKDIYVKQYHIPLGFKKIAKTISRKAAEQDDRNPLNLNINDAIEIWEEFKADYYAAMRDPDIKTIGIDAGTDAYALIRVARFGKLDQVDSHLYGPVYLEFSHLIRSVFDSDGKPIKNLITTHELKDEYKKYDNPMGKPIEMRTGERILDGYRKFGHLVQINCQCFKRDGEFVVKILDCRDTADFDGLELIGSDANFDTLKNLIIG